ncbi:MAG: prolipoprotein diacylglyceryl transferase family protein [Moraxella osloensis]
MYLLAFAAAYALAWYRTKSRPDWNADMVADLVFYGAMGVIPRRSYRLCAVLSIKRIFSQSDVFVQKSTKAVCRFMGIFGCRHRNAIFCPQISKEHLNVLDFIIPCVPTGLLFGRIGNFINGELWGRVSDGGYNWLMRLSQAVNEDNELLKQTSLQSLCNLLIDK